MRLRTKTLLLLGVICLFMFMVTAGFGFVLFHRTAGHYFESNGARIFYTVEGDGPPVILVHGVAANADLNWRRPGVVSTLARNFQVVTFDLRGHGLSDKPVDPDQYGLRMVEDIVLLMDHLEIARAHVAGYSLGGFLALKAATLYPDRIASLAVCAAGWMDPEHPVPIPNPYRPPVRTATPHLAAAVVPGMATPKTWFNHIRNRIGDHILPDDVKKALKKKYAEFAVNKSDLLALDMPVLCIIGDKDGFLYLARDLVAVKPDIVSREIPDAGHFSLPLKKQFRKTLSAFFLEHTTSR